METTQHGEFNEKSYGEVIENTVLLEGGGVRSLRFFAPKAARRTAPGQLVHIKCGAGTTLRRPFSIAGSDGGSLRVCYDVRGVGTEWMAALRPGDIVDFIGPLGRGYPLFEGRRALLAGGGTGIFSLLSLAARYGGSAKALLGFRSSSLVCSTADFESFGTEVAVATDDGSAGKCGLVTDLLREELAKGGCDLVYVCGPRPMMACAAGVAAEFGAECYVSMEERMGCGVGACMGCVCRTVNSDGTPSSKRICIDGPVFSSKEIVWQPDSGKA